MPALTALFQAPYEPESLPSLGVRSSICGGAKRNGRVIFIEHVDCFAGGISINQVRIGRSFGW